MSETTKPSGDTKPTEIGAPRSMEAVEAEVHTSVATRLNKLVAYGQRLKLLLPKSQDGWTISILVLTLTASIITAIYVHLDAMAALAQSHVDARAAERAQFTSNLYSKQVDKLGEFFSQCDGIIPLLLKRTSAFQPKGKILDSDTVVGTAEIAQLNATAQQLGLVLPRRVQVHVDSVAAAVNKFSNLLFLVSLQPTDAICIGKVDYSTKSGFDFHPGANCSLREDVIRELSGVGSVVLTEKEKIAKCTDVTLATGEYLNDGSTKSCQL
jgi:hypothetical protein